MKLIPVLLALIGTGSCSRRSGWDDTNSILDSSEFVKVDNDVTWELQQNGDVTWELQQNGDVTRELQQIVHPMDGSFVLLDNEDSLTLAIEVPVAKKSSMPIPIVGPVPKDSFGDTSLVGRANYSQEDDQYRVKCSFGSYTIVTSYQGNSSGTSPVHLPSSSPSSDLEETASMEDDHLDLFPIEMEPGELRPINLENFIPGDMTTEYRLLDPIPAAKTPKGMNECIDLADCQEWSDFQGYNEVPHHIDDNTGLTPTNAMSDHHPDQASSTNFPSNKDMGSYPLDQASPIKLDIPSQPDQHGTFRTRTGRPLPQPERESMSNVVVTENLIND
jgi:hypothetical protein